MKWGNTLWLWLTLFLFELALVGKIDSQETPVGAAVAILATAATASAVLAARVHYHVRLRWIWLSALVLRNIVRDTLTVFGVLLRCLAGGTVEDTYEDVRFDPGGDDAASATRRGLAIAGMSTSPNEIVLDLDRKRHTLRVHLLAVTGAQRHSEEWPL